MQMFVEGMDKLTEIARSVDPHYDICAFRAGGWAVQPFDKLKKAYQAVGLKIDSSVAYGAYYKSKSSFYDFRKEFLKEVDTYRFDDDVLISKENGEFLEVPISTYKRSLWLKVVDKIYRICTKKPLLLRMELIKEMTYHLWKKSLVNGLYVSYLSFYSSYEHNSLWS